MVRQKTSGSRHGKRFWEEEKKSFGFKVTIQKYVPHSSSCLSGFGEVRMETRRRNGSWKTRKEPLRRVCQEK